MTTFAEIAKEIADAQYPDQLVWRVVDNGGWFTVDTTGGQVLIPMSTIREWMAKHS
jgi:hypothetical protein